MIYSSEKKEYYKEKTENTENTENKRERLVYTATCLFGLEALLGEEIDSLGYRRLETIDGRVTFEADRDACAVCNINLRFAERLYLTLSVFHAETFSEVFDGTAKIPFERIIDERGAFPVKGHSIKSRLFSVPDLQKIIKKAAAKRLGEYYGREILPEDGVKYQIEFFILRDICYIMLDLSGAPLHKRGYRPERVAAPLRETLAAAIVKLSRPREGVLLRDPFCGSGTVVIEGAMMMKNIAPGQNRSFAAEEFPFFPRESWESAREAARRGIRRDVDFRALGSDIDARCVEISKRSAERAGVSDITDFVTMDALDIESGGVRGTIVTNPPYGERLMDIKSAEELYCRMGKAFKGLGKWQMYILTSDEEFEKYFARRADKVRKLYNGMIPCRLYQYFKNR